MYSKYYVNVIVKIYPKRFKTSDRPWFMVDGWNYQDKYEIDLYKNRITYNPPQLEIPVRNARSRYHVHLDVLRKIGDQYVLIFNRKIPTVV